MTSAAAPAKRLTPTTQKRKTPKRRQRRTGMSMEEMYRRWPLLKELTGPPSPEGKLAWEAAFTMRPDAMVGIIQDIIKQTYAVPGRIGQRPMPREEEVDIEALLYGENNELPLVDVLPKLIKVSERAFAQKVALSRSTLQRLLKGEYQPDIHELRRIAEAVGKPPVYFMEYRKMMAVIAFVNMIEDRPGIASRLYREYLEVRV